jgi:hypothetical protein
MSGTTAGDSGVALLERLLLLSERKPGRIRPASTAPEYDLLPTAESVRLFESRMLAAERAGAIKIHKGIRERRHLIERVSVIDAAVLANHLGRTPAATTAAQMKMVLEPLASRGEAWVAHLLDALIARWSRGESAFRLPFGEIEQAKEFVILLAAISRDEARGLDARTFSLKVTNDTKAFDRQATRIASVLAAHFGEFGMAADRVWNRIGLERFSHPVHVKGCVVAEDAQGVLVHGRAVPFASFHPDMTPLLKLCGQPRAILTIENYATFNRYVREIDDGTLVVYTGGFASAGVLETVRALLKMAGPAVPYFHWGDIDPGGVRIFRFLEEAMPRPPVPHLMDRSLAEIHGKPAACDPTLSTIAMANSAIAGLADWLCRGSDVRHLEQEAIDPASPLSGPRQPITQCPVP